jgi:hypothetical protein
MSVQYLLLSLGFVPLFASRVFLPAFLFLLFINFPDWFPFISFDASMHQEGFLSSKWLVFLVGTLALIEIIADKTPEFQEFIIGVEKVIKPAMYVLVNLQILDISTVKILDSIQYSSFHLSFSSVIALSGGIGVLVLHSWRSQLLNYLVELDSDDSLGIRKLISYLEDSFAFFSFFILLISAFFGVVLLGIFSMVVFLMKSRFDKSFAIQTKNCEVCGVQIHKAAVKCYSCHHSQVSVNTINVVGRVLKKHVIDYPKHKFHLLSLGKCPVCTTKLPRRLYHQNCSKCNNSVDRELSREEYLSIISKRNYKILFLSFIIGFVPFLGFIVSIIIFNLYILSPLKRYLPKSTNWLNKITSRIILFIFISIGIFLGFLIAPIYNSIRYFQILQSFKRENRKVV